MQHAAIMINWHKQLQTAYLFPTIEAEQNFMRSLPRFQSPLAWSGGRLGCLMLGRLVYWMVGRLNTQLQIKADGHLMCWK